MRLFVHEVRTEQMLFWRNREAAFFTFFLPIIFFLVFGSIYGNGTITEEHVRAAPFLEAGMIGYGVASTAFAGLAITMVIRRESGVLKRIRATPLPPATYLLAVLVSTFIVFLIETALIVAIGRLLFSVALPDRPFSLLLALAIGAVAFAALGLGLTGYRAADWLYKERQVAMELADERRIMGIITMADAQTNIGRLITAMEQLVSEAPKLRTGRLDLPSLRTLDGEWILTPQNAFFGPTKRVAMLQRCTRWRSKFVIVCPR